MKLTRAQRARLGAFVVSGTVLFVGVGLVLTGLKVWERHDVYTTRFTESVSGLEVSAPVKYRGLRVGAVSRMQIAADDPRAIEVTLSLDPGTPLYEGTTAVLDAGGLTGLQSINLIPGDTATGTLAPGSFIPPGPSLLHRLTGQAEQIAIKIEIVANELALWTRAENRLRLEKLIDSVTTLSDDADAFLGDNREGFKLAVAQVGKAAAAVVRVADEAERSLQVARAEAVHTLAEAQATLREVRRPLKDVDEKEVAKTLAMARQALVNLDQRLSNEELGKVVSDLIASLAHLTELVENVDMAVRASREDWVSSLSNLEDATEDIREFSRIIAQDPSTLIMSKEKQP